VAEVQKTVRFYETVKVDQRDQRLPIEDGFWTLFAERLNAKQPADRESIFNSVTYVGEAHNPRRSAYPYVQVRRVRSPSEQLDLYNTVSGDVGPLLLDDPADRVAEPTYIVPFGLHNYVAVMSPAVRGTRPEAIESWLTDMCGLTLTDSRVELRPIIDEAVLAKLMGASGASKLSVKVNRGDDIPDGGGVVADAVREAARDTTDEMSLTMTWSFGHAKGSLSAREKLLAAAQWVANTGWTDSASVSITVENPDGELHVEQHNIFRDRVTKRVNFVVEDGQRPSESVVVTAVAQAIREFGASR